MFDFSYSLPDQEAWPGDASGAGPSTAKPNDGQGATSRGRQIITPVFLSVETNKRSPRYGHLRAADMRVVGAAVAGQCACCCARSAGAVHAEPPYTRLGMFCVELAYVWSADFFFWGTDNWAVLNPSYSHANPSTDCLSRLSFSKVKGGGSLGRLNCRYSWRPLRPFVAGDFWRLVPVLHFGLRDGCGWGRFLMVSLFPLGRREAASEGVFRCLKC